MTASLQTGCADDAPVIPGEGVTTRCLGDQQCGGTAVCYSRCACETSPGPACCEQCALESNCHELDLTEWSNAWLELEARVVELTNNRRASGSCCGDVCFSRTVPLTPNAALAEAARSHARNMALNGFVGHESPDGGTPFDRIRARGFRGCAMGENIAAGSESPEFAVNGWMSSATHCANIMSEAFTEVGVGYYFDRATESGIWVQTFGG